MAIFPTKIHDEYNASNHMEFVMDQDSDVALLPGLDTCAPGSKATSIASGNVFYLTTFGFWTKNTKALVTEELRVDKPGTYTADEGKAFNPVIVADVGNPNYVETIEGTLANPWGNIDFATIANKCLSNDATMYLVAHGEEAGLIEIEISLQRAGMVDDEIHFGVIRYDSSTNLGGALAIYAGPTGNATEAVIEIGGVITDLLEMAEQIPTTLTIIHHPLPDSGT